MRLACLYRRGPLPANFPSLRSHRPIFILSLSFVSADRRNQHARRVRYPGVRDPCTRCVTCFALLGRHDGFPARRRLSSSPSASAINTVIFSWLKDQVLEPPPVCDRGPRWSLETKDYSGGYVSYSVAPSIRDLRGWSLPSRRSPPSGHANFIPAIGARKSCGFTVSFVTENFFDVL